jgi:hypothetical protein
MSPQDLATAEQAVKDYQAFRDSEQCNDRLRAFFEKRIFHMEKLRDRIREALGSDR